MVSPRSVIDRIFDESRRAREVIAPYINRTPVDKSTSFSHMVGCELYLKYENMQKTGAFKVRGALYKVSKLRGIVKGVVAASAGNHAQGVAYAASIFGLRSVIVMPRGASISKIEATKGYGAEVVLHGEVYDDAEREALRIARERGYEFVHAFDDIDVIAGQGTIGFEILEQVPDVDVVVVPIGGGGLISGIATVVKRLKPGTKVIGVEPENAPKMKRSIEAGHPVEVVVRPSIADGLLTRKPGRITYEVVSELVDDIVLVSEDEIAKAIYLLLERAKVLAEGAGAAALAALLSGRVRGVEGRRVLAIVSGGNIDLTALYRVLLRGLASAGRIARLRGVVPDTPGSLYRALEVIARHGANIVEVIHDRTDVRITPWHAAVDILLEVPSRSVLDRIVEELRRKGMKFEQR